MKLKPTETSLNGRWELLAGKMIADDVCKRIEDLKSNYLEKITTDASGWDTLYRDPQDGRYWELVYLQAEMHGGGPPSLLNVSAAEALSKYGIGQG